MCVLAMLGGGVPVRSLIPFFCVPAASLSSFDHMVLLSESIIKTISLCLDFVKQHHMARFDCLHYDVTSSAQCRPGLLMEEGLLLLKK